MDCTDWKTSMRVNCIKSEVGKRKHLEYNEKELKGEKRKHDCQVWTVFISLDLGMGGKKNSISWLDMKKIQNQ